MVNSKFRESVIIKYEKIRKTQPRSILSDTKLSLKDIDLLTEVLEDETFFKDVV